MSLYDFATFQVAAKTIMRRGEEILVLTNDYGEIDFPGGRMDKSEINLPITDVLKRELAEEIGTSVVYETGQLAFVSKRQFTDKNVLLLYYETTYISGKVEISDEHVGTQWIKPSDLPTDHTKYISLDEFEQVQKYLQLS